MGLHVVVVVAVVPDVVVHVEVEEWSGLAPRLRDDEVVEGVVLRDSGMYSIYEGRRRINEQNNAPHPCRVSIISHSHAG